MPDSIQERVGAMEQQVHTLNHRVGQVEETHKETPHRLTRLEHIMEDLPEIKRMQVKQGDQLTSQGDMLKQALVWLKGCVAGAGILSALYVYGPDLLKIMGAK